MVKPNGLVRGFHQMFYLFGTVLDAYVVNTKLTTPVTHVGLSFLLVESIFKIFFTNVLLLNCLIFVELVRIFVLTVFAMS